MYEERRSLYIKSENPRASVRELHDDRQAFMSGETTFHPTTVSED